MKIIGKVVFAYLSVNIYISIGADQRNLPGTF
jgi:hypothetical protein